MKSKSIWFFPLILVAAMSWGMAQAETEAEGNILKIGTPNEVKSASVFSDYYLGIFAHISNPPLMKMDRDGDLVGQTAERVEVSDDHTEWTFFIRDDLYWSDGKALTPEDVRFSIVYTGEHNPNARWIQDTLTHAEVKNGNRVVLTFSKPYTGLRLEFATYNIFPKHIYEQIDNPMQHINEAENIGFGPFYIESIDLDAGIIAFTKNPHWRGESPVLDGFEIHMYKNLDVLSLALENGDIDTFYKYASSYPYANIDRLEKTGQFDFSTHLNMGLVFLAFNVRSGITADVGFREALSYAIDYEEIVKLDAVGYGRVPNFGFVPPSMGAYKDTPPLDYDPEKARELLSQHGYRDADGDGSLENRNGETISLTVLVRSDWTRVGELLQDYLDAVGIDSTLRSLDLNGWVAAKDEYDYDVTITRTTPWGMLMHANWGTGYFDARRTGRGVLHTVEDSEFLTLCDTILATTDESELTRLGHQVQDYYTEQLPGVALYWNEIVIPYNRSFSGWKPDPLYGIYNIDTLVNVEKQTE